MIATELNALLQMAIAEETCGLPAVTVTSNQQQATSLQQGPANTDVAATNNNNLLYWLAAAAIAYAVFK
jgi:hypothetical protein